MTQIRNMPGHLVRRLQQVSVAIFIDEVGLVGSDITPVQFAALATTEENPGIDQATLAGLIAYDRTTIGGVVDRLVQKGLLERKVSGRDRRARELQISQQGAELLRTIEPAVEKAQQRILNGLNKSEARLFLELLRKATAAVNELSRAPMRPLLNNAKTEAADKQPSK